MGMWRGSHDQRTTARYHFAGQTDNNARVAKVWFGEFESKFRGGSVVGRTDMDVKEALAVRERLQCKPFVYFLHRFRKMYVDGGLLPDLVFKIRAVGTSKCMLRNGQGYSMRDCQHAGWFHLGNMIPEDHPTVDKDGYVEEGVFTVSAKQEFMKKQITCGAHKAKSCSECPQGNGAGWCHVDCQWYWGTCINNDAEKQKPSARKTGSGLREWNGVDCLDRLDESGPIPYNCDITGVNQNQKYSWESSGVIRSFNGKCLYVDSGLHVRGRECEKGPTTKFERIEPFTPPESNIFKDIVEKYHLSDSDPDH